MANYARLFAECVTDAQRDYYVEHPELRIPGYWIIKLNKRGYPIAARTYWRDYPDRVPPLLLVGDIAGEPVDVLDIFANRDRRASTEAEYSFLCAERAWAKQFAPDEPAANPQRKIDLSKLPLPF